MVNDRLVGHALRMQLDDDDERQHVDQVVKLGLEDVFPHLYDLLHLCINPRRGDKLLPLLNGLILLPLDTHPQRVIQLIELTDQMVDSRSVIDYVGPFFQQLVVIVLEGQDAVGLVVRAGDDFQELALVLEQGQFEGMAD